MKSLLTFLVFMLLTGHCFCQITLGPRLGVNFSRQGLDSPYETWKTGTVFGGVVKVPLKYEITFQGEFLFSQKGYRMEFNGDESYDELTSKYWEVPVFVNYQYSTGRFKFFGQIGAFGAFWKSGSYESKIGENDVLIEDYDFTEKVDQDGYKDNRVDFGFASGLGVLYDKIGTSGDIILEFRFTKGFTPISSLENPPQGYTSGKNTTLSISLAYMFYL